MVITMRRSHLEKYIEIIGILFQNGPLKPTPLMYKANLNSNVLKKDLNFLVKQSLIEELTSGNVKTIFAITQKGINVLKYFQAFKQDLQIIEETKPSYSIIET
jgi:predicted transcriptional regulator